MTIFFRNLALVEVGGDPLKDEVDEKLLAPLQEAYYAPEKISNENRSRMANWVRRYKKRLAKDGTPDEIRRKQMNTVNPKYVPRNYLVQLAIDKAEQDDYSMVKELLEVSRRPYDDQAGKEQFAEKRPEWARHRPGCSMLSCSS